MKKATHKSIIMILLTTNNNAVKDFKWSYKNKVNKERI